MQTITNVFPLNANTPWFKLNLKIYKLKTQIYWRKQNYLQNHFSVLTRGVSPVGGLVQKKDKKYVTITHLSFSVSMSVSAV